MPRLIKAALQRAKIGRPERASSGVDVIGDIAIVRLAGFSKSEKKRIGEALLLELKNEGVVMEQVGGIEGDFRLRSLRHLAGEKRTLTTHRENGCLFRVDVARTYFSPRLSTERMRVAEMVRPRERVLNMFAGVGPFSIVIAKKAGARVTSCELNPYAAKLHVENNGLNKVSSLVSVITGDAEELTSAKVGKFDRILMPHPSKSDVFLPVALKLAKRRGTIHYYRHVLGKDVKEAAEALSGELRGLLPKDARFRSRCIRAVGPRWMEMAADVRLGG